MSDTAATGPSGELLPRRTPGEHLHLVDRVVIPPPRFGRTPAAPSGSGPRVLAPWPIPSGVEIGMDIDTADRMLLLRILTRLKAI